MIEQRLTSALRQAMRERDAAVISAIRSALAAIHNAEAVAAPTPASSTSEHVAGAVVGVGAAEAQRAELDEAGRRALVTREADELRAHAEQLRAHGREAQATSAELGAAALMNLLR